ncbi:hypothetical protein GGF46_002655 [Coemansia sp. RSA 552]|nr:hypothetical protein GGF46_002655 [Coemansia sp. RSA 552]
MWRVLTDRRFFILGLVVAPVGLYAGVWIKDRRAQGAADEIRQSMAPSPHAPTKADEIRTELDQLQNARTALRRQESLLQLELESIRAKLHRLDKRDARQEGTD